MADGASFEPQIRPSGHPNAPDEGADWLGSLWIALLVRSTDAAQA
jgi:hypothetical protein